MANIKANITELRQLLDITPAGHNLMLVGNHGIGKSEILTSYFSQKGMTVVALFLGQMSDPGDLIGLPRKNEQTGKTDFMPRSSFHSLLCSSSIKPFSLSSLMASSAQ